MMKQNAIVQIARRLWDDESGAVMSTEIILIATIVVIGAIVGLATYRDAIVQELADTGIAISTLNQSYLMVTDIDGSGGQTVTQDFGDSDPGVGVTPRVSVTVTVFDSSYTDNNDSGDNTGAGTEGQNVADPAGGAPGLITFTPAANEGP